jgi:NAD(P)-dependent dehydrogenase (short-subunit alcohol dehydrogenase family)
MQQRQLITRTCGHLLPPPLPTTDLHNEEKLAAVANSARELGRRVATVSCDVRRRSLVDAAVKAAVAELGAGPDILLCSAGGWARRGWKARVHGSLGRPGIQASLRRRS